MQNTRRSPIRCLFPSNNHPNLIFNEYLTLSAFKALLPDDDVAEFSIADIADIAGQNESALLIKCFDRSSTGRIHFEEFNQLLGHSSSAKYDDKTLALSIANATDLNIGCLKAKHIMALGKEFELSPAVISMS